MTSARLAILTRALGAAALLVVGLDHLEQLTVGHYSAIPTIGTLFALNFASATIVAGALVVPWRRLSARAARIVPRLLAAGGIGIAAGSIAGLLISESGGLFGFQEVGYRGALVLALGLEAATLVLLSAYLAVTTSRPRRAWAAGATGARGRPARRTRAAGR
jgi:hypothetical protein